MRKLDYSVAKSLAVELMDLMDAQGYSVEEAIPGLIETVCILANDDDQLLNEAANLLADGGVGEEPDEEFWGQS